MLSDDKKAQLVKTAAGLRVTDICDGMDAVGLQDVGTMEVDIRPLWRDVEGFAHRIYGFAHTVRFLPTNKRAGTMSVDDFDRWKNDWYEKLANAPRRDQILQYDIIVIDGGEIPDCGFIGSHNTLEWVQAGAVGAVTNGGCRDTDEIIRQKVPVYSRYTRHGIRPGRVELDGLNENVNVGGAMVRAGDFVVADGDGVIVVPVEVAERVVSYARRVQDADKKTRRAFYDKLGMPPDFTVK
jgi:regulator of RNase E activity RraA